MFALFVLLEKNLLISPTSINVLKDMLKALHRGDLLELVVEYQGKDINYHNCL